MTRKDNFRKEDNKKSDYKSNQKKSYSKEKGKFSNKEKKKYSDDSEEKFEKKSKYLDKQKNTKYSKHDDFKRRPKHANLKKQVHTKSEKEIPETDEIRLNRYIAAAGICSRREADTYIQAGLVSINGETITELGTKVKPGDIVRYNDQIIKGEKNVYILLNKPKDYITTLKDPHAKRTVMSLIEGACKERVYPVGRLDRNTTGVLLLTNDGDMTTKLTHPKNKISKIYHVVLDKSLTKNDMIKITEGVELEDGIVSADKISYVDFDDKKRIGVEIHSGKNRIIRRIFEHLDYKVMYLDRVSFAGLTKKNLKRGTWRFLTEKEISFLKMLRSK